MPMTKDRAVRKELKWNSCHSGTVSSAHISYTTSTCYHWGKLRPPPLMSPFRFWPSCHCTLNAFKWYTRRLMFLAQPCSSICNTTSCEADAHCELSCHPQFWVSVVVYMSLGDCGSLCFFLTLPAFPHSSPNISSVPSKYLLGLSVPSRWCVPRLAQGHCPHATAIASLGLLPCFSNYRSCSLCWYLCYDRECLCSEACLQR